MEPRTPRRSDAGALVLGGILLLLGVYFLLQETLGLELPDIGQLWPVALILVGVVVLYEAWKKRQAS